MKIQLTKNSDLRHHLEIVRDDGSRDGTDLESKAFVVHDFLHYAIETEAGLRSSFWGQLRAGRTFAEMAEIAVATPVEMMVQNLGNEDAVTEAVVGVLTGALQNDTPSEMVLWSMRNLFNAQKREVPAWLTPDAIAMVKEKMRQLLGEWRSLPYGKVMELEF
jgi:hypothetical protein